MAALAFSTRSPLPSAGLHAVSHVGAASHLRSISMSTVSACTALMMSHDSTDALVRVIKGSWLEAGIKRGLKGAVLTGGKNEVTIVTVGPRNSINAFARWCSSMIGEGGDLIIDEACPAEGSLSSRVRGNDRTREERAWAPLLRHCRPALSSILARAVSVGRAAVVPVTGPAQLGSPREHIARLPPTPPSPAGRALQREHRLASGAAERRRRAPHTVQPLITFAARPRQMVRAGRSAHVAPACRRRPVE